MIASDVTTYLLNEHVYRFTNNETTIANNKAEAENKFNLHDTRLNSQDATIANNKAEAETKFNLHDIRFNLQQTAISDNKKSVEDAFTVYNTRFTNNENSIAANYQEINNKINVKKLCKHLKIYYKISLINVNLFPCKYKSVSFLIFLFQSFSIKVISL